MRITNALRRLTSKLGRRDSSKTSATIWYVVGEDEYFLAKQSVSTHLAYPWVNAIVVLHTGSTPPGTLDGLGSESARVLEIWAPFGSGLEIAVPNGGFDQVAARNHALAVARETRSDWVIQCDADEIYLESLGAVLANAEQPALRLSMFHLTSPRTFWVRPAQVRHTDTGVLYCPHVRIWRTDQDVRYVPDPAVSSANATRHCGPKFLTEARVADVPGVFHLHLHHLLNKPGWDTPKTEGVLDREYLPASYEPFLRVVGNPNADGIPNLRLVTDVFAVPRGEQEFLIYAPLRGTAQRGTAEMADAIGSLSSGNSFSAGDWNPTIEGLQGLAIFGRIPEPRPAIEPLASFHPIEATLLFNESCNLGCSYCYASSRPGTGAMPKDIAEAALKLVVDSAAQSADRLASIRYLGGGEPTISWDLVEHCTAFVRSYATERDVRAWIRLITNGTLITSERARWIAANIDYVTLSFEILPALQVLRAYVGGKSSHSRVLETLGHLASAGVPFELRCTVTEEFLGRMVSAVEYCAEIPGVREIRFEPVSELGRARELGVVSPGQERFVREFWAARQRGRELGINVRNKMTRNADRIGPRFCEAEFSVAKDGSVSACHRFSRDDVAGFSQFAFGRFADGKFTFDLPQVNSVRQLSASTFTECQTCFARWNCAGECLAKRVQPDGRISDKGTHCHIVRGILANVIDERLTEAENALGG